MTQKIRVGVFETNSSSTHSLCIAPEGWKSFMYENIDDSPYEPITCTVQIGDKSNREVCIIKTSNYYKRDNYCYVIEGDLQKIQFIVSSMSSYVYDAMNLDLQPHEFKPYNAIVKAIREYISNKYDVSTIIVEKDKVYHDSYFVAEMTSRFRTESKYTCEEVFKIVTRVISDPNIVFICYSDETGPFPEDIELTYVGMYKDLIKNDS